MISAVRAAVEKLGRATEDEIRVESGLARWQVESAVEMLLRRGDVALETPTCGLEQRTDLPHRPRVTCRSCPFVDRCVSSCALDSPGLRVDLPTLIVPADKT